MRFGRIGAVCKFGHRGAQDEGSIWAGSSEAGWTRERFEDCTLVCDSWSYGVHAHVQGEKSREKIRKLSKDGLEEDRLPHSLAT